MATGCLSGISLYLDLQIAGISFRIYALLFKFFLLKNPIIN